MDAQGAAHMHGADVHHLCCRITREKLRKLTWTLELSGQRTAALRQLSTSFYCEFQGNNQGTTYEKLGNTHLFPGRGKQNSGKTASRNAFFKLKIMGSDIP